VLPTFKPTRMKKHITLSDSDRDALEEMICKQIIKEIPKRIVRRAGALIALDSGKSYAAVARRAKVKSDTVQAWAKRYREEGLGGLEDKPKSGRRSKLPEDIDQKIAELEASPPPPGCARWSDRLLCDALVMEGSVDSITRRQLRYLRSKRNQNA